MNARANPKVVVEQHEDWKAGSQALESDLAFVVYSAQAQEEIVSLVFGVVLLVDQRQRAREPFLELGRPLSCDRRCICPPARERC